MARKDEAASEETEDDGKALKSTATQHFINFMNELLDVMETDKALKESYLVLNDTSTHKSQHLRQIIKMIQIDVFATLLS